MTLANRNEKRSKNDNRNRPMRSVGPRWKGVNGIKSPLHAFNRNNIVILKDFGPIIINYMFRG